MINSYESLNFDENMTKYIKQVESVYEQLAELEDGEKSMLNWINTNINENINDMGETNIFRNLTDREKFLFTFAILANELQKEMEY